MAVAEDLSIHLLAAARARAGALSAEAARLEVATGEDRAAGWELLHATALRRDMAQALVGALTDVLREMPDPDSRPKLTSIRGVIQAFGGRAQTCAFYRIKPQLLSDWANKGRIPANRADQTRAGLPDFEVHGSVFKMVGHASERGARDRDKRRGAAE
jgi:hypothetical protein